MQTAEQTAYDLRAARPPEGVRGKMCPEPQELPPSFIFASAGATAILQFDRLDCKIARAFLVSFLLCHVIAMTGKLFLKKAVLSIEAGSTTVDNIVVFGLLG